MTFEQYKAKLNESINSREDLDIDFSTILGLLAQYNLRYINENKRAEFSAKHDEIRKDIIIGAYSSDASEVSKMLLDLCDVEIVTEFTKEKKDSYLGLYNVHNLLMKNFENENLALDIKSLTKANRLEGERQMSQARINEEVAYINRVIDMKSEFNVLSDKDLMGKFAQEFNKTYEEVFSMMQKRFEKCVEGLVKPEKTYLNTVVEDVISWDKKFIKPLTEEIQI